MATVTVYKQDGSEASKKMELRDDLFGVDADPALVHRAVVTQEANARQPVAHTKDRSEVRGSNRKPWRQKGTGRARHGSRYTPLWRGGGITFGPSRIRNFKKKLNKKARRKALAMVLSDKAANDQFIVVESLALTEPKTKLMAEMLANLPHAEQKTLLVLHNDEKENARLAARNIPNVAMIAPTSLNVVDLLKYGRIVASADAVEHLQQTYKRA